MASCGLSYGTSEAFNDYLKDDETKLEPAVTELVLYPLVSDSNNSENNISTGNNGHQGNINSNNTKHRSYNKSELRLGFENDPYSNSHDQSPRKRHALSQEVRNVIFMEHKKYTILTRVSANKLLS